MVRKLADWYAEYVDRFSGRLSTFETKFYSALSRDTS